MQYISENTKRIVAMTVFGFMVLSMICLWNMASMSKGSHNTCPISAAANTNCAEIATGHFQLFEIIINQNSGATLVLLSLLFIAFISASALLSNLCFSPRLILLKNIEILQTTHYYKSKKWLYNWLSLKNKNLTAHGCIRV